MFALLLGSGLSRAAEIPTGWEITLDLVRRVALAQGIEEQPDWAEWHRKQAGEEPSYSALLEELAFSPEERRSILHGYIEPTEEDRQEGRKLPTAAHHAIAALVRGGHIRVIVTTNFDRLLENALREAGIEPTVVASPDALAGAEPITHTTCYILKLHGDYKYARILNTDAELNGYPAEYDRLLDRILDEHGLIVCGWSGEWDHALRAAFLRAPNRRYSVFWTTRGRLGDRAQELVDHRRAQITPIASADCFFATLRERVETLELTQRQHPLSIELLVGSAKRFLAKAERRIQLDDLLTQETERVLSQLDAPNFNAQSPFDQAAFRARVHKYESVTEPLASVSGVLGRWGDDSELLVVQDIIRTLYAHAEKVRNGVVIHLNLRSYPAVLVFTAYGIGLTRAGRWSTLHRFLHAKIDRQQGETYRTVDSLFLEAWKGTENNAWKQIEGLERRQTPLSDHLLRVFIEWGKRFAGLAPAFELVFERFEMLASLAYLERHEKAALQQALAGNPRDNWEWMPIGRMAWHSAGAEKLLAELKAEPESASILEAGFAKADSNFLDLYIQNFTRIAGRMW